MEAAENQQPEKGELSNQPTDASAGGDSTPVLSNRSLRRLRDRVERAARELRVLREENTLLQERVTELEALSSENTPDTSPFFFESDPESVKRKVDGFIQAIDQYLDNPDRS